ncbi:MAG: hypothetical protein J6L69_10290 [Lachnospiraceae bacterium]|nr:hypothetical protein [Lachnospiraceae bacterium]
MTDRLWEVYPVFLDAGYTPSLFWDSSIDEIIDMLDSSRRKEKKEAENMDIGKKYDAILNKVLAQQIMEYISMLLPGEAEDKKKFLTPLQNFFPQWFADLTKEMDEDEKKKVQEAELELNKARMEEFMFWNNQRFKGGE